MESLIDTVIIEIPKGYELEAVPKNTILETPFSKYSSEYSFEENKLKYIRRMEISETLIPLESYEDYYDFMKAAIKSDASNIVFKK
ncbi:MAG: DUF3858 domain-containing protein [Melioribacteraceae bacterium]|nr:DUF3858 domain-containing protein [Melioribacteraceae bacterium]MCF8356343.1 DUF3858 domain-containing protein [Melioribacteraceae bacterium]MCF8395752.1 DUF3858 domain-containing protein [Melioribacteraceae bacterium]MCF8420554.1 DUF3858 domain-containing protein [Melioribacteraceae bacterium]